MLVACAPGDAARQDPARDGSDATKAPAGDAPARAEVGQHRLTLPDGFSEELVVAAQSPTGLSFLPDGRLLVATQPGVLLGFREGDAEPTPVLDLSSRTCAFSEQGMLGVAPHPNFGTTSLLYVFYTYDSAGGCVNRVSRFAVGPDGAADATGEQVLIDNIPAQHGNHNGGDVQFGSDGLLYVTTGDGGCDYDGDGCIAANDAARDLHVLLGKVLRITADGGIPWDNPFVGSDTARCSTTGRATPGETCQETFAWGLRNPWRLAFDPNAAGVRFYVNDVGQDAYEEVNEGIAGADYGWNLREGFCETGDSADCGPAPDGVTDPLYSYVHADGIEGCDAVTGGAFVPQGAWTQELDGAYLFGDYACGAVFRLVEGARGLVREPFVTGLGTSSAVHLAFGPRGEDQALYYTTYVNGGEVRRIVHTGSANRRPLAEFTAAPSSGRPPVEVVLDAGSSYDHDEGDTLSYQWDLDDGTPAVITDDPVLRHTYTNEGPHQVTLRVLDQLGGTSDLAGLVVTISDDPPIPSISAPSEGDVLVVGDRVTLRGAAFDDKDGELDGDRLSWTVTVRHDDHTHPFVSQETGRRLRITIPTPEAPSRWGLEVVLNATDSGGLTSDVTQHLRVDHGASGELVLVAGAPETVRQEARSSIISVGPPEPTTTAPTTVPTPAESSSAPTEPSTEVPTEVPTELDVGERRAAERAAEIAQRQEELDQRRAERDARSERRAAEIAERQAGTEAGAGSAKPD